MYFGKLLIASKKLSIAKCSNTSMQIRFKTTAGQKFFFKRDPKPAVYSLQKQKLRIVYFFSVGGANLTEATSTVISPNLFETSGFILS